jgi:hypothetical protein
MVSFPIISGMMASSIHVLSGPDHLAAVTPIVIQSRIKAWRVGLSWGMGHVTGMFCIGILVYFFKEIIPYEMISGYSEKLVGFILIAIGIWVIYGLLKKNNNGDSMHFHYLNDSMKFRDFSFGIGFIHGLAGVSHLILLLPVLSFANNGDSIIYIVGFCVGSIISMIGYTIILRLISRQATSENHPILTRGIQVMAGLFALIIGIYWMV